MRWFTAAHLLHVRKLYTRAKKTYRTNISFNDTFRKCCSEQTNKNTITCPPAHELI